MKRKVAFINAFPSDFFFAEVQLFCRSGDFFFFAPFWKKTFVIDQEVCFFFQSAVYFVVLFDLIIRALIK